MQADYFAGMAVAETQFMNTFLLKMSSKRSQSEKNAHSIQVSNPNHDPNPVTVKKCVVCDYKSCRSLNLFSVVSNETSVLISILPTSLSVVLKHYQGKKT